MIDVRPALEVGFRLWMGGLMPLRKAGIFGTPDAPLYFCEGESVPLWIEVWWPFRASMTFSVDAESYWDGECQVVRPVWKQDDGQALLTLGPQEGSRTIHNALIVGAPTHLHCKSRTAPRQLRLATPTSAA